MAYLSDAQMLSVALQDLGIAGDRIATQGYGESKSVASNDSASNRQLNRRVAIILSDADSNI